MGDLASRLKNAANGSVIVRVCRKQIDGKGSGTDGYVMAFSKDFLLLQRVNDEIVLDGYEVLRIGDISALHNPTPYFTFKRRAPEGR